MIFFLCVLLKVSVVVFHVRVSFGKTGSLQVLVSKCALLVCIWKCWVSCVKTGIFVPVGDQIRSWSMQELFQSKPLPVYCFWWFSYLITCACNKILFNNTLWISQFLCLIFSGPGMDNKRIIVEHLMIHQHCDTFSILHCVKDLWQFCQVMFKECSSKHFTDDYYIILLNRDFGSVTR